MTAPARSLAGAQRMWRRVRRVLGQSRIRLEPMPRLPQAGDWIRIEEDTWRVLGDGPGEGGKALLVLEDVDAPGRFARLAIAAGEAALTLHLADGRRLAVLLDELFVYPASDDGEIGIPSPS
jgi:hypothetical protein